MTLQIDPSQRRATGPIGAAELGNEQRSAVIGNAEWIRKACTGAYAVDIGSMPRASGHRRDLAIGIERANIELLDRIQSAVAADGERDTVEARRGADAVELAVRHGVAGDQRKRAVRAAPPRNGRAGIDKDVAAAID